ncbi:hypothetical protein GLYMA_13G157250v4 [Glycine max]|nr:hypothetical protein GLYMA_13G157250v4 [Glycine max]
MNYLSFQFLLLSIITQPSCCSKSHIPLLNQCRTVIEPFQQPSITTHWKHKSSSFQYLLPCETNSS